jgi:hypothetical protein
MNIRELKKQAFEAGQRDYWLERFAELVAAHEREECAKVCEEESNRWAVPVTSDDYRLMWAECATAIRARSKA